MGVRFLIYLTLVGLAVYLLIALIQAAGRRRGAARPSHGPRAVSGSQRPPIAPDDDPEFLAELDRRRRMAERKTAEGAGPGVAEAGSQPRGGADPTAADGVHPSEGLDRGDGEAEGPEEPGRRA